MATSKRPNALAHQEVEPLNERAARAAALDALSRRDYASEDLRRKLLEKGYDGTVVAALIDRLHGEKLLDDRRYAESFVAYHASRGQGPIRVRTELHLKGIEALLIEESLGAFPDWIAQLRRAQQKKFGAQPPNNYADRQRQSRFLAYRGFTSAHIRAALGFDIYLGQIEEL